MNRVLLDQGLAPRAAELLRREGWDAVHVGEIGLDRADDPAILEYARQHGFACITLDHDFHSHLATNSAGSPSVVFLRAEGLDSREQAALIGRVWAVCGAVIEEGAAVSADGVNVRWRRLPLGWKGEEI